jgi:putative acetyltransferase
MPLVIRVMRFEDARTFLEVHHAAIRGIAARDYPDAVVAVWAAPISAGMIDRFLQNRDNETRLVAELDGRIVGVGAVVIPKSELRACYVAPDLARTGIGSALVNELERIAKDLGLDHLHLESSLTAERFYLSLGYRVEARGELRIAPGVSMAAVTMRKTFR